MKTRAMTISLLTAGLVTLIVSLNCGGSKTELVAAQTKSISAKAVSQLPDGKPYEIDLTKRGTVYTFDDPDTDFSRVSVKTSRGVKSFADMLKESNARVAPGLVLGRTEDMRDHLPPSGEGTATPYDCGVVCKCTGTTDCMSMILDGKCIDGGDTWGSGETRYCVAKP